MKEIFSMSLEVFSTERLKQLKEEIKAYLDTHKDSDEALVSFQQREYRIISDEIEIRENGFKHG